MKNLFYSLIFSCLFCTSLPAQNNLLQNFRQNIPMYTSSLALILGQTKIDPVVTDIIAKVLPEVANENVDGAILSVTNILYQRKGIKALDPEYSQFLDTKIRSLIDIIKKNDYFSTVAVIGEIALRTNDYIHSNFNRSNQTTSNASSAQLSNSRIDINKFKNNIFAYPTPRMDWTKEDIDELHNGLKTGLDNSVKNQNTQNISAQQVDDLTDCICNQVTLRFSKRQLNSIPNVGSDSRIRNMTIDCMNKVGLNTSDLQSSPNKQSPDIQSTTGGNNGRVVSHQGDVINRNLRGPNGETIYTGPKGGNYYLNKDGNKVYVRPTN